MAGCVPQHSLCSFGSGPLDEADTIRSRENNRLGVVDEQAVFHDAWNSTEPRGELAQIGNNPQVGIQNPVSTVGHEDLLIFCFT